MFYDYLITNLKLYFDRFEEDLSMSLPQEPTTDTYEETKDEEINDYKASQADEAIPQDSFNNENPPEGDEVAGSEALADE